MSFAIHFYNFSKKENSTKRPTGDGNIQNCIMKHGSGLLRPTISIDVGLVNAPVANYAYIPSFGRYYFIKEWFFEDALWTANLEVDVLATYKTQIGNSSLYVLRSSAEKNGNIIDNLYPTRTNCNFATVKKTNPWNSSCFVVGIVSKNGDFGSLNYYVLVRSQLRALCTNLMDDAVTTNNGYDWNDFSQSLQRSIVDPLQYIKTCVMLPVGLEDITNKDEISQITVFNWPAQTTGWGINPNSRITNSYEFAIEKHPDTNSRGNYVNTKPYTNVTLSIPPWGVIEIDSSVTCTASKLNVDVDLDPLTGKAVLVVKCNGIILNRVESQVGVPISISQVSRDYIGAAQATLGAVGSALTGNFIGAAAGVGNAVNAMAPRSNTIGSTGAFVSNRGEFKLDFQFFRPVADDNAHNGRPLCAVRNIASLGGYMLIQDGDVSINGTNTEGAMIRNYLEGGFYYE